MGEFTLHDRLAVDTVPVTDGPLSAVRLMIDRTYPWLILVPRQPALSELHDLADGERVQLMAEISTASACLQSVFSADKINVGALGNLVAQLHVHVVARFASDPAWPGPVWGAAAPQPYDPAALEARVGQLRAALHQAF